jgi:hypothetical protein
MGWAALGAAAIGLAGGLIQYLNSAEARELSAAERKKLEDMLMKATAPNFDYSTITPEEFSVVRRRAPDIANFIAEKAPTLVEGKSADAQEGRAAQREALRRLISRGTSGPDLESKLMLQEALQHAGIANRGRVEAVKEDFARRGQLGGGNEFLAQLVGAQYANEEAANAGRASAIEAIRSKAQSLMEAARLGGQIRSEDVAMEGQNADIRNQFIARTAQRMQNQANLGAQIRGDVDRENLVNEQDIANRNTASRNDARVRERDYQNSLKQRVYDNTLSKIKIHQGLGDAAREDIRSNARDTNSAIAGASEGAMTGLGYMYNPRRRKSDIYFGGGGGEEDDGYDAHYDRYAR